MPGGRPRKPLEQKILAGNPGKRPLPAVVEYNTDLAEIPRAPIGLKAPGKRFWLSVWEGANWLDEGLDANAIELAARLYDELSEYRKIVAADGYVHDEPIISPSGKIVGRRRVPNPIVPLMRAAEKSLQGWLIQLAISPTSRVQLVGNQVRAQSGLEQMLRQRNQPQVVEMIGEIVEIEDAEVVDE